MGADFQNILGATLVGASIMLTLHSMLRMIIMRTAASKLYLFPIINISMLVNEFAIFFYAVASENIFSNSYGWLAWTTCVNNLSYFTSKPPILWLAYLRCRSVYPDWRRADWFHFALIAIRAIELFAIFVASLVANILCPDAQDQNNCPWNNDFGKMRDGLATLFRLYYIVAEAIFFVKLFSSLVNMSPSGRNNYIYRYRYLQALIFACDLLLLTAMSIYRLFNLFETLPNYVYVELFSTSLTIFNLTEFGLALKELFKHVSNISEQNPTTNDPTNKNQQISFSPQRSPTSPRSFPPVQDYSITISSQRVKSSTLSPDDDRIGLNSYDAGEANFEMHTMPGEDTDFDCYHPPKFTFATEP